MDNLSYTSPNILVVDDLNTNLVVLTEIIRNAGAIARPVTTARQAVRAIEALTPHLILLDISMPEIDGFMFCTMLKKNANTRNIPVIFIAALTSPEDKIKGFQLGAVDFIEKPFETQEVTLRIITHLKTFKMQQELELYNKKLYKIINEQIHKIYEDQKKLIYALAKLIAVRDSSIADHLERIGKNSRLLAMSLQLSPNYRNQITNSFIDAIEVAAPLHDIGKIAFSDSALLKPMELDEQETEIMKTHSSIGADTLQEIYSNNEHNEFLKMAIDIARFHHENWDGSGYPNKVMGTDIPLCARIVSIIDRYNSLTSQKVYTQAYSHELSMKMINEDSSLKFDPDIVTVFNKIQHQLKK